MPNFSLPKILKRDTRPVLDRVLLIGINYEGTRSQLNGCRQDVANVKEFLTSRFDCKEIKILDEKDPHTGLHPTRRNITESMKWLVNRATSKSRLFIHYSGHGSHQRDDGTDEIDGQDESLCPLDYVRAGMITDDEVRQLIVDPLPAGAKLWGIFDCCHSGTQCDLKYTYKVDLYDAHKEYRIISQANCPKSKAEVFIFSGCEDTQTSADAWIAENRRTEGAMTWGLLKTIRTLEMQGQTLSYKNIVRSLSKLLKDKRYTQRPQFSTGHFCNLEDRLFE